MNDKLIRNYKIINYFADYNINNYTFNTTNEYGEVVIISMTREFTKDELDKICGDLNLVFDSVMILPEHQGIFNYVFQIQ